MISFENFSKFRYLIFSLIAALILLPLTGCQSLKKAPTPEQIAAHDMAVDMLKNKTFLIKADRLSVQNRAIPGAIESTNFVTLLGNNALVQVSPGMSGGPNGVGGFTVRGTATGYSLSQKANGEVRVEYHVSATVGSCEVIILLNSRSADATVFISNSFKSYKATIYGKVVPVDDSFNKGYTPF